MSCDYSRNPSLFLFFSCFVFKQILGSWSFLLITYKKQTRARVLQVPLPNDCLIIHRCSLISLGKGQTAFPRYNLHVMNLFVNPRLIFLLHSWNSFTYLCGHGLHLSLLTISASHVIFQECFRFQKFPFLLFFNGSLVQIHRTNGYNQFSFHFCQSRNLMYLGHA